MAGEEVASEPLGRDCSPLGLLRKGHARELIKMGERQQWIPARIPNRASSTRGTDAPIGHAHQCPNPRDSFAKFLFLSGAVLASASIDPTYDPDHGSPQELECENPETGLASQQRHALLRPHRREDSHRGRGLESAP